MSLNKNFSVLFLSETLCISERSKKRQKKPSKKNLSKAAKKRHFDKFFLSCFFCFFFVLAPAIYWLLKKLKKKVCWGASKFFKSNDWIKILEQFLGSLLFDFSKKHCYLFFHVKKFYLKARIWFKHEFIKIICSYYLKWKLCFIFWNKKNKNKYSIHDLWLKIFMRKWKCLS